ncbi:alpha/beta hydrolase [Alistipes sp.]|uniref:alpha/beta hydrolase n=1 Tax=Alistipes sp. TaxID=1872444 RepID=UPI003AF7D320
MKRLLAAILLLAAANAAAGEKSVSLERDFGTLRGTLLTPEAGSGTAALIIAGSGPTPRNGNANNYLYLAQALEKAGVASLRYDKRGIGASLFDDPAKMSDAVLEDFIGDAAAWAEFLAGEGFRRIVLIGHSEGALIAFCAAQQAPEVDAVISLAGAGYPLDEVLQLQLAAQLAPDNMALLLQANAITASLKRGERVESYPPQLEALFHPSVQTFWISSLRYDPRTEIRKVTVPVLLVNGDNDLQVPPDNAEALAKAQPRARKIIIRGMTHPLKKAAGRTPADQMAAYGDSTLPLDPDLAAAVTEFIESL